MTVEESYAFCERVARTQAKNFYYSFLLLSRPQRQAMCAIYAFMRYCDDLSDDEGMPRPRRQPSRAGGRISTRRWPGSARETSRVAGVLDAVQRYRIPHEYFCDMIDGVSSDLEPRRIQTFRGTLRLLLSRGQRGGTDHHSHFRFRRSARA